jgi:predicted Zn-dependent peptidase
MANQDYRVIKLHDKSRLVLIPMPNVTTFATYMCVNYGSEHVTEKEDYECAHFLEHLLACLPSEKYPSAPTNDEAFNMRGIFNNAYTYPDKTIYEYRGLSKHLDFILELMTNAYVDFKIDETTFEQERQAVLNELKRILSIPLLVADETIEEYLFQEHTIRKGCTVRASYENTKSITKEKLLDIWRTYYGGSNVLFVVAGGFDADDVEQRFISMQKETHAIAPPKRPAYIKQSAPRELHVQVKAIEMNMIKIIWILPFSSFQKKKTIKMMFVNKIMCQGMTSRLYKILRTERGLVYSVSGGITRNEGNEVLFTVSTQVDDHSRTQEVMDVIIESFENALPITDDELESVKNHVMFHMEEEDQQHLNPSFWFDQYHDSLLFNKPIIQRPDYKQMVKNVTSKQLTKFCKKYFKPQKRLSLLAIPQQ